LEDIQEVSQIGNKIYDSILGILPYYAFV
jgi:hypothetical protein